ncbi:M17 family metallopeptidase [Alteromonas facilis]|uniref:M17 family metallopeptidase n=1 Tax=Alteromonas facilis TaxID=2048004 RepID=UPI000C293C0D|nr:leucyl aminopeptidase family protein [Alteromonas facilis]
MPVPHILAVESLDREDLVATFDAAVIVSDTLEAIESPTWGNALLAHQHVDARVGKEMVVIACEDAPGKRLVHVPTGKLNHYYDDVRRVFDSARSAAKSLVAMGSVKPLVMVNLSTKAKKFAHAIEVAGLGIAQGLWQPLEAREALVESDIEPVSQIGLVGLSESQAQHLYALELGKRLARDLCGTEPERMAPPNFANYCVDAFKGTAVKVDVIDDDARLRKDYPLLHAVARASVKVTRHQPRVVRLTYEGKGLTQKSLFLAGKGITFDTGGADLKVGGHMAGMSRDKGGAASVAGFMRTLAEIAPPNIKVVAELGVVRNSIGDDAFVPDEIIKGHAGVRVRVGNTDAEGRMVLADVLSHLRELALEEPQETQPELFSVATLTGHAAIALGPYTGYVQNGAAEARKVADNILTHAEPWGDCGEVSRSRREDYAFIAPRTKADDVLSSNNAPSVSTMRGHQFPMAFLAIASGLDKHDVDSTQPMPYTHVDIAGSGVENSDWQHGTPTAAAVTALVATYALPALEH